jgi:adenylate kinase family enzyme
MNPLPSLAELGPRICVLGPSNSGKSTLADAIGRQQGLPVVHLDQLYHVPHTAWQARPRDEFHALHEAAIEGERWVIEGNYSSCVARRFARATGVILLDVSTLVSLRRYVRRTLFERQRVGSLEGARERVNMAMLMHIVVATPPNRRRYASLVAKLPLPKVRLASPGAINAAYAAWQLALPRKA